MKNLKIKDKNLNVIEMNTFFKKLKGLMWNKEIIKDCYLFKNTNGIHTFFMFQNIDVILTDKNFKVLKIYENLSPFKVVLPKKNVYYTIEAPIHVSSLINVGEVLTFEEN